MAAAKIAASVKVWRAAKDAYRKDGGDGALAREMWANESGDAKRTSETRELVRAAMRDLAAASNDLAALAAGLVDDVRPLLQMAHDLETVAPLIEIDERRCTVGLARAEVVVRLIELKLQAGAAKTSAGTEPQQYEPVERAIMLLMRDKQQPKSVRQYATQVGVNRSTLSRNPTWQIAYAAVRGVASKELPRGTKDSEGNLEAEADD